MPNLWTKKILRPLGRIYFTLFCDVAQQFKYFRRINLNDVSNHSVRIKEALHLPFYLERILYSFAQVRRSSRLLPTRMGVRGARVKSKS
jgi:hypothetical protein